MHLLQPRLRRQKSNHAGMFIIFMLAIQACSSANPVINKWNCLAGNKRADLERSLPFCEQVARDSPPDLEVLQRLGDIYYSKGEYQASIDRLLAGLELRRVRPDGNEWALALHHYQLAQVYYSSGRSTSAEKELLEALPIFKKGHYHGDVDDCLQLLGLVYERIGRYGDAVSIYRQEAELLGDKLGTGHRTIVPVLTRLAEAEELDGQYSAAEDTLKRIENVVRNGVSFDEISLSGCYNNLGRIYSLQGRYTDSVDAYTKSLRIRKIELEPNDPLIAQSQHNLGLSYYKLGRMQESEDALSKALSTYESQQGGATSDHRASTLNALGSLYQYQERWAEAQRMYEQATFIFERNHGLDHPLLADVLNNRAVLYEHQGDLQHAAPLWMRALSIQEKRLGQMHPDVATSLQNLAIVAIAQGQLKEAESLLLRALKVSESRGANHPDTASLLFNLGLLSLKMGQPSLAVSYIQKAESIREILIRSILSEKHLRSLVDMMKRMDLIVYGLPGKYDGNQSLTNLAMGVALLRKGRTQDVGALVNHAIHLANSRDSTKYKLRQMQDLKMRQAALQQSGTNCADELHEIQQKTDQIANELTNELINNKTSNLPDLNEITSAVSQRMELDSVLVDIELSADAVLEYENDQATANSLRYVAFILFPDRRTVTVSLSGKAVIDQTISNYLNAVQNPNINPQPLANALYKKLFHPLRKHVGQAKNIYLSLDGRLNLVPFDALHDGTDYLLGKFRFMYLTSGRDLLRIPSKRAPSPALILADPDFVGSRKTQGALAASQPSTLARPSFKYQTLATLPPLPGAIEEAKYIQSLLGVDPLTGEQAQEEALRAARAPWILHIATHGLFLNDVDAPALSTSSAGRGALWSYTLRRSNLIPVFSDVVEKLPNDAAGTTRSALVLAGAARGYLAKSTQTDGVLTSDEAGELDLDGTQLVVLSACETGKGDTSIGQGIYGLRRGFLSAGAETLVTSLWRVDDQATSELMRTFYSRLLALDGRTDRGSALQQAMVEIKRKRPHPYYWAPFIMVGQGGALRPLRSH